ncbi:hypothetical protein C0J52_15729 [Blattella germanica]|nr:hypothetical protein C0J52_15729 [Blattella germanica]
MEYCKGKFHVDPNIFQPKSQRFTAVYSRDREYLFDIHSTDFFTPAIHSRIVQFILDRQRYSDNQNDDFAFGIERLINELVYTAAYPLHDGNFRVPGSMRHTLYAEWASVYKCLNYQPLDYVKEYFGVKIGLYFAWLGFYTYMLIPVSVVGIICFIYSISTLQHDKPSQDICTRMQNITMCPICDWCGYWKLGDTCVHSRVIYLVDNPSTVFFAIVMSFWAALFLELWKRYSAEITHRWDLTGFDTHEEHPRPQYLARLKNVKKTKENVVTKIMEPDVPFWRMKLPATMLSISVVLLLIALAVAAVLGVVLYRMSFLASLTLKGKDDPYFSSNALLITSSTAATINLACIMVFNWIYIWVARYLTELELLRTQTEFEDSLTLKIYLLQFVNYYASIFYIAFFKDKFTGYPGKYNRFFGYRQEQYGFVTIFVAAFPLAPFFALLNNILEMRLDAKKLLTFYRRPVTQRVRDIGVWYRILDSIGKLSVITNNVVAMVMILVRWCIPDMPGKLRDQIRREAYITNEIIIQQETRRAQIAGNSTVGTGTLAAWKDFTGSDLDLAMQEKFEQETDKAVRKRQAGASSDRPVIV